MATDKLGNLLNRNENAELVSLVRRARSMETLCHALAAAVPSDLAADLVAANVRDGELVVVCRTPARAARLRFESETLLSAASSAGEAVTRVTVRVSQHPDPGPTR